MNKKRVLGIGALMSVLTCSVAFAVAPNKIAEVNAADNSHFLSRFINDTDTEFPYSESGSSWTAVKTAGKNKQIKSWDKGSTVTWTISYGKYDVSRTSINLGSYILNTDEGAEQNAASISLQDSDFDGTVFRDIHNAVSSETGIETYSAAMVSDDYITNIQDIAFYWRSLPEVGVGKVRIVYLLSGESQSWHVLKRDDGEGGVAYSDYNISIKSGTGVSGDWNAYCAIAGDPNGGDPLETGDFCTNLKGKTAKIGVVFSTNSFHANFYYYLTGISINRAKAMKDYIDYLDGKTWVCEKLPLNTNFYNNIFKMCGYKMLQSQADELNVAHSTNKGGKETTYYRQFAYLYNIATNGSNPPVQPSTSIGFFNGLAKTADGTVLVVVSLTTVTLVSVAILVLNKKKKHN